MSNIGFHTVSCSRVWLPLFSLLVKWLKFTRKREFFWNGIFAYKMYFVILGPNTVMEICFGGKSKTWTIYLSLFDLKTNMKCVLTLLAVCTVWRSNWQRSCISTRRNVMYLNNFFFSPLRQAWNQAERAHLLSGDRRGLLWSPAQCHQGKHS